MRKISNNFIRLYQLNPIFNLLTDISSIIDQILKFSHHLKLKNPSPLAFTILLNWYK